MCRGEPTSPVCLGGLRFARISGHTRPVGAGPRLCLVLAESGVLAVRSSAFTRVQQSERPLHPAVVGEEPAAPEDSSTRLKAELQTGSASTTSHHATSDSAPPRAQTDIHPARSGRGIPLYTLSARFYNETADSE